MCETKMSNSNKTDRKNKMNIWLLRASEPLPINKDERLWRMGMIAQELDKRGHNITWFTNTFDHFQKKQLYDKDTIVTINPNYHIYLIHGNKYKKNISLQRLLNHRKIGNKFRKIAKNLEVPDLIYASHPTIEFAEEAVKYGKKHHIPVIVDIRDLWPDIFKHNLSGILKILAFPYIAYMNYKTKKTMKNAFAINAVSEAVLEWGLKKGNREKTKFDKYFYIGYDRQENNNIQTVNDLENLIDKTKFNISFFATINNQFDYEKVARLAKKLQEKDADILINICGDGPQMQELKKLIEGFSNVKLFGWVGKEKLDYILKNSKIGLAPYKNTFDFQMSVSNKFAEYSSYGLPIALTSEGYMKKLIVEHECGISTQNMEEMANFIVKLKNNDTEYKKLSDNALKLYEEKFMAEKIYPELVDYLEKIKEEVL